MAAGGPVELRTPRVAAPCVEFTCHLRGEERLLSREDVRDDLEFLDDGTRGYLLAVDHLPAPVEIAVGDPVLAYIPAL